MLLSQSQKIILAKATELRINAAVSYKRAWMTDPTPRGYPSVDRALTRLETAEAMERAAERGELPADTFDNVARAA